MQDSSGDLSNIYFLHDGSDNPREAFTRSLIDAIRPYGTMIVYSSYEQTIIGQLADLFPRYQERLSALPGRFLDLLMALRVSEASAYTLFDTPAFTGLARSMRDTLDALG